MNWIKENWFKLLAILFLLGALGSWPYSYYQILRWVVALVGVYAAYIAYNNKRNSWVWIFGIIAVIFNPIVPVYLSKNIWQFIDIIAAIVFFVSFFYQNKKIN